MYARRAPVKLTPRLQAIADKVPPGSRVADIGTDHAYIPVYLLVNRLSPNVIATDSRQGPLATAGDNLNLFSLSQVSQLRLGAGLSVLKEEDRVETVIIAGMGGETICSILAADISLLKSGLLLVLQPMTNGAAVRKWLVDNRFEIIDEDIASEDDDYYEIIVAKWSGTVQVIEEKLLAVGPVLVANKHPLLKPLLGKRLNRLKNAKNAAAKSSSATARSRVNQLAQEISWLEAVNQCL